MRKISLSPGTKKVIIVVLIVVLFGSVILASSQNAAAVVKAIWDKFMDLLSGHIS
jgi:Na+/H+ antiporter NhaC